MSTVVATAGESGAMLPLSTRPTAGERDDLRNDHRLIARWGATSEGAAGLGGAPSAVLVESNKLR